ncbi:hypothetical protein J2Y86_001625 [Pseudomonas migulae]|nr:hypothetical protein [Pseudomonas migulae]MCP1496918.1 hypothetical protein [Pseudomonas migulae]
MRADWIKLMIAAARLPLASPLCQLVNREPILAEQCSDPIGDMSP